MKIFTSAQIHELDKYTIENEPVKSIDLMERAAKAITQAITDVWNSATRVIVFAGPGNNGGDALAVARLLLERNYDVTTYLFNIQGHLSEDCAANKKRLLEKKTKALIEVIQEFEPPQLDGDMLVVDGLFGSGLNKPLAGGFSSLVKYINASPSKVVSIDIPSGLMTEDNTYNVRANIIRADMTLTLQHPTGGERRQEQTTAARPLCPQRQDGQCPHHCGQLWHGRGCRPGHQGLSAGGSRACHHPYP